MMSGYACGMYSPFIIDLHFQTFYHSCKWFDIKASWKRKLVALLLLSYSCIVTINVLWLFLTVPLVGLQCVIVVVPDHTHFFI